MNIDFARVITAETRAADTLAQARAAARSQVLAAIGALTAAITGPVPLAEMLCWAAKEAAARALAEGRATEAEAALIAGEAAVTGEGADVLVVRILGKADAYRGTVAALTGLRRATEADIDAAPDAGAVAKVTQVALERLARMAPAPAA